MSQNKIQIFKNNYFEKSGKEVCFMHTSLIHIYCSCFTNKHARFTPVSICRAIKMNAILKNARWSQHTCIFARCQLFTSWWKFMLYSTMYQHLITGCKFNKISLHLMGLWHHIITVWKKRKSVYTPHNGILNIIK